MISTGRLFNSQIDQCLLRIKDGLFKNSGKKTQDLKDFVFRKPIENFEIYRLNNENKPSLWSITGPGKSQFLAIVSGKYLATPALSRTYPFMLDTFKYDQIQFLNFKEASGLDKVHLSARYESYSYKGALEISDDVNSVRNYITGANNYNSNTTSGVKEDFVNQLLDLFNLNHLSNKWINSLSNGQLRRARLAKALINKPSLFIIDDPFLGLDPEATKLVSHSLHRVSKELNTSVVLGLRVQDDIPEWLTHVGYVATEHGLKMSGAKEDVLPLLERELNDVNSIHREHETKLKNKHSTPITNDSLCASGETPHIEFSNASVVYKNLPIFTDFNWKIPRGSKWRILGNNGTGKTTLLSLITADHPQSWRSVLSIDGVLRKTGSGVSFFDVNNKIGISSPELHALVPGNKTMMQIIMNGLVPNVANSNFTFIAPKELLTPHARALLGKFDDILASHENDKFSDLSITNQKLTLFLRAVIKNPEILILDEAFSCMDEEQIMIRCHDIVENELKNTTVLAIAHIDWEICSCDYVLKLHGDEQRTYSILKYD